MAFGSFHAQRQPGPMADINVTPMVDVMLVLLVIFILSAPMLSGAVKLELPRAQAPAAGAAPLTVTVALDAGGQVYWNDVALDAGALAARLAEAARQSPQPVLQLRADKDTRYEVVAQLMAAAQSAGVQQLGFVTLPPKEKK